MAVAAVLALDHVCVARGKRQTLFDISLTLAPARTLAVVGESGAGKTTLIAAILGLVKLSQGRVTWDGAAVRLCRPALVMQEPRAAFNPTLRLRQSVLEPITAQHKPVPMDRLARLCDGMELPVHLLDRRPHDVSIGQAQRAGIVRALIAGPPLVVFDEPLSALDAVTQKHTARLIAELQREEGFASLIVTHDLGYAAAYSDDIIVLREGRIAEASPTAAFIAAPRSDYGIALREAAFALGAMETA
ncbi:ATP-binding cassette domain-containing protein [Parasphingorhabdus sp.]|uniref:ABC transporter ATP-binding protein n=1 Tax=Parasphingorhabdus sp. TaxID=2709688 RepID=UPI0032984F32